MLSGCPSVGCFPFPPTFWKISPAALSLFHLSPPSILVLQNLEVPPISAQPLATGIFIDRSKTNWEQGPLASVNTDSRLNQSFRTTPLQRPGAEWLVFGFSAFSDWGTWALKCEPVVPAAREDELKVQFKASLGNWVKFSLRILVSLVIQVGLSLCIIKGDLEDVVLLAFPKLDDWRVAPATVP